MDKVKFIHKFSGLLMATLMILLAFPKNGNSQTPYVMSGGNYSETFTNIANTTNWPNGFNGTDCTEWGSVAINASGTIGDGVKTSVSTATFVTGSSGGVQRGTANIQMLSTSTANSCAIDLFLDFTGRNAGTVSFDLAEVNNSTGDRDSKLKLFYSTNGTTFTEITGTNLPFTARNNVAQSGSVSVSLPSAFNGSSTARLRFYEYSTTTGATPTGSQPKISIDNIVVTSISPTTPTISVSTTSLTGFTYLFGNGPSANQTFTCSGTNLTNDISLSAPADYEISLSAGSGFGTSLSLVQSAGTVSSTIIYVRLISGLGVGTYNSEIITAGSTGATNQTVTCSGSVTNPTITVSPASLSGFTYIVTSGPSANQTFSVSGNVNANVNLTAPTDFEIATASGGPFGSSLSLAPTGTVLSSTTIYVRLISGLAVGAYSAELITASSTGATSQTVTCNGTVTGSSSSDVIPVTSSEAASVSSVINTAGPLTSTQGVQVWQFTIRDGGASSDADNLATIVNAITIANLNSAGLDWSTSINSIDLFDGTTNVGSLQTGSANLTATQAQFTGLNINVPDNSSKTITVRLSLLCPLGTGNIEGDYFRFSISSSNFTVASSGSQKTGFSAAQSTPTSSFNDIDIVATQLQFLQQPTTTGNNTAMTPSVTVKATDACGNMDAGFTGTISITSTGTLTGSPVAAIATAGIATFSGLTHTVVGTNFTLSASSAGLTSTTSTLFDITVVTNFGAGDIAIVGMCVDMNGCGGSTTSGEDEISFVSFEDITPGTTIDLTDNGFERVGCSSNTWGNTEGVIRITRTTSTLPKGTIVTLRILDQSIFSAIQPDGNWTVTYPNSGFGTFNLNSNDEQVYIMQGGTWNKGTSSGSHDATYSGGTLMFAINTYTSWVCDGQNILPVNSVGTKRGDLPLPLKCFSILPGIATKNIKYTGLTTAASQKDWVDRLNSPSNWTGTNTCAAYVSGGLDYGGSSQSYSILAGGFNSGYWTGATNTDWYDCNNWQNYKVPDSLANVIIDNVANDPVIRASPVLYPNGAVCNDLLITNTSGSGILTLNNSLSYLSVKGNITNNGFIASTNGLTDLRSANSQTISGIGTTTFYNLRLNNTNALGIVLSQNVTASNTLAFTNGMLSTGTNKFIITNTIVPTISGYTSSKFINGNLRQYIASNISTYVFPIGDGMTSANYKRADIVNNNLTGVNYLDAFVNSITETAPNDDATFASAGQTQNGSPLGFIMENAQWDFTPDAAPTGGTSYGVRLYTANTGLSSSEDDQFFAVKRPSSSVTYADWVTQDGTTTIPVAGAAGRIYNSGLGYAERLGYTSFSKHAIASIFNPLPIELLIFTGTPLQEKVQLNWTTATEINNDYFTIEKSSDAIKFESIGTIKGAGTSSTINHYVNFDLAPFKGINYYRLKQTDFNGKYTYSNVISVMMNDEFSEFIYPNPATNNLFIRLSGVKQAPITLEILTLQGITLLKKIAENNEGNDLILDLQEISAGTYILKTTIGNKTKQTLFIKQ